MSQHVEAQHLEEGNEILVRRGDVGIVEEVVTAWAGIGSQTRTTVTLNDGRFFRVKPDHQVTVYS